MERDQLDSEFTSILRRLWTASPHVLAATFADVEGECIDYVSSVGIFEAKVAAAHMQVMMRAVRASPAFGAHGEAFALEIATDSHEVWARWVGEEYVLVTLLLADVDRDQLRLLMAQACREFRGEAGIAEPNWEAPVGTIQVGVRDAVTWPYAPASVVIDGKPTRVSDVLGHWTEQSPAMGELACFRVRTEGDEELTLVHFVRVDGWQIRTH